MKDKLSNVPSEILLQALHDLSVVESMPKYSIYMSEWMRSKEDGTCSVCLAGAVMVNSYGRVSPNKGKHLNSFEISDSYSGEFALHLNVTEATYTNPIAAKMRFINNIRQGDYADAFINLSRAGIITDTTEDALIWAFKHSNDEDRFDHSDDFSDYDNKELFINHICAVIGTLQAHGA